MSSKTVRSFKKNRKRLNPCKLIRTYGPQKSYCDPDVLTCSKCGINMSFAIENNIPVCYWHVSAISIIDPVFVESARNYNNIPWKNNEKIPLTNGNGCTIFIEKSDEFSIKANIGDVLTKHLSVLKNYWTYMFDTKFTTNPTDYVHDCTLTLEKVLEHAFGVAERPIVPSLYELTRSIVGLNFCKRSLLRHKILPPTVLSDI